MSLEGWTTEFVLYRETVPGGVKTGPAWRPPGVRGVLVAPQVGAKFERQTAHGVTAGQTTLHQKWEVAFSREFGVDTMLDWWLLALVAGGTSTSPDTPTPGYDTTVRQTRTSPALASFGLDCLLPDGNRRRIRGMVPSRLEWTIQGGKVVREDVAFQALRNVELEEADMWPAEFAESHRIVSALNVQHALTFTTGAWPNPAAEIIPTFASQIIFSRMVEPCHFDQDGYATRYEVKGSWDALGKSTLRCRPGEFDALLLRASLVQLWWKFTSPADPLRTMALHVRSGRAKLSDQVTVDRADIDNHLDWVATEGGAGLFTTTAVAPS